MSGVWVSVKDKLPPSYRTVIIFGMKWYGRERRVLVGWHTGEWDQEDCGNKEWEEPRSELGLCSRPLKNVTHWMPLPEAPNLEF